MIDKDVAHLIAAEEQRQRDGLELIPSENYVSRDVLTALGSVFTNKYSEGFPRRHEFQSWSEHRLPSYGCRYHW